LETCIVVGGATYKSDDVVNKPNDNTYTILRSNNIKNGFLNLDDLVFIKNDRKYKKEFIQKGDILVCSNNGSKKLIGKNCLIENEMPNTLFGGFMMVFRNSQPLIRYFIQTKIFKRLISNSIGQINSITKNSLKNINLYLPSLQEQKQIAHFLETIDNTILTLQDQLKQTEQLKKYYLDKLFPKNNKDIPELRFKEFNKRER
jgi:type I restriction enzyme S subunit